MSGVPFAGKFGTVSDMDGGITVRVRARVYFDHANALEAGLRE